MGTAGGVDHRHVSVRRSTAPTAADRIDRIARLENLRAATATFAGTESVRILPHRTTQDHHHHTHRPALLSRAPDHHEIAGDQIIQECVPNRSRSVISPY